ncbi:hypothetical protein R1sor_010813 [Riccia sorocarpa]|uniref:Uncharacterized protein n=1 Tax=Riccia sorocarpa TaxID=122646 RepID=A0ABD3HZ49_9MARC
MVRFYRMESDVDPVISHDVFVLRLFYDVDPVEPDIRVGLQHPVQPGIENRCGRSGQGRSRYEMAGTTAACAVRGRRPSGGYNLRDEAVNMLYFYLMPSKAPEYCVAEYIDDTALRSCHRVELAP